MTPEEVLAEARDWIDDLPGVTRINHVYFDELMVPVSAIREHYAALASRGWRLYQFDNPVEVAGGVAMTPEGERAAIAADRTWASGYAAGRAAAQEPAGAGLGVERLTEAAREVLRQFGPDILDRRSNSTCGTDLLAALWEPKS